MRAAVIALTAAIVGAQCLTAQVADTSAFRPLSLPTPSALRSGAGAPGPSYWQNRADYTIEATLDTTRHEIRGRATIRYYNNSPDSLRFVWLQMDQDILAEGSINRRTAPPPLVFANTPFDMAARDVSGGFTVDTLRADRGVAGTHRYDTMRRVDLERPMGPGEQLTLDVAWRFTVPPNGAARMGRDGSLYEIAQWYPRLAVYDDVSGWNTMPYIGAGEFYLEYGDFDVRLTVPATFVVAATGELLNAAEVLTPSQVSRLARARATDAPIAVISADEAGVPARSRPRASGSMTWRFTARNVRDFAWAAAPNFRWDATRAGPTLVQTFYRPRAANWEEAIRMASHAITDFSARWFPYPYPQATVVEGPIQGMEYPMIVFVPADTARTGLGWVLIHELGHEWFPMVVGNDERRYPWMDEGFNSFIDLYTVSSYFRPSNPVYADSVLNGPLWAYPQNAVPGEEQPLITAPAEVRTLYWNAYQKPALMLRLLREEVLGAEGFDAAFREYARRWAFRHPQPADFFRTMENVSGRDLDWFWRGWVFTTSRLDQAVDSVSVLPNGDARLVLWNRREMVMPAELRLTWAGGGQDTLALPVEIWNLGRRFATTVPSRGRRLLSAELDPRRVYPDVDRANNVWRR